MPRMPRLGLVQEAVVLPGAGPLGKERVIAVNEAEGPVVHGSATDQASKKPGSLHYETGLCWGLLLRSVVG